MRPPVHIDVPHGGPLARDQNLILRLQNENRRGIHIDTAEASTASSSATVPVRHEIRLPRRVGTVLSVRQSWRSGRRNHRLPRGRQLRIREANALIASTAACIQSRPSSLQIGYLL